MKAYCKNYDCPMNKKLDEPYQFKFSQVYVPFEGDKCKGECSSNSICFESYILEDRDFIYEGAKCMIDGEEQCSPYCGRFDCLHNEKTICTRDEILIDQSNSEWVCRCYSQTKIKGHMDWFSRFCNSDGTAKGGHIDDSYAQKMDKWSKTTRSYRTHMKQNT